MIKYIVMEVIALGKGEFQANLLPEFDVRVKPLAVLKGKIKGEKVTFAESGGWSGVLAEGKFTGTGARGKFEMIFKATHYAVTLLPVAQRTVKSRASLRIDSSE